MKKIHVFVAMLVAGSVAFASTCGTGACTCASCELKESGTFTLAGLEGLNEQSAEGVEQSAEGVEQSAEGMGQSAEGMEQRAWSRAHGAEEHGHDHENHGHGAEESCCPHDEYDHADVPHDHDHAEHAEDAHAGCSHDHGAADPHAGHDHGTDSEGGVELSAEMQHKVGLKISQARGGNISRTSVFPAEIKLNRNRTASVSPRYASIVLQVFAEIGDEVKKGDFLASLENRETMAVYSVTAPQDGVIISKDLAVGETAAEDRVLYQIADLSSVWADISIFPQYQHLLSKGATVEFIAHDGCTAVGSVQYISPIVSHETRTFTARCILVNAKDDFTPGVFVRARIKVESVDSSVVVPRAAIQLLDGEEVVFIPSDHGFITAPVKTGLRDEAMVEIKAGLNPGDEFVAKGAFTLKAQMVTSGMDPHAGHGH